MGKVRPRLVTGRWGDLAFKTLSLGLLAHLGACATHGPSADREAPLENQTDEVATYSQPDSASFESSDSGVSSGSRPSKPAHRQDFGGPRSVTERVIIKGSRAPRIAAAPFQAGGLWMNSFYFVRSEGESWESISNKLYARSDRADLVRSWNSGKRLEVGSVIYYNSPFRPDDSQNMKVFAEDFGSSLETVTVQEGDWLSKIGLAKYGNVRTWIEIAALNPELTSPDELEVGQTLRLQPAQVNTQAALDRLIQEVQAQAMAASPLPEPEPQPDTAEESFGNLESSSEESASLTTEDSKVAATTERPTKSSQGPPVSEDHMLFGALGLLCVLLSWMVFKRVRARRALSANASLGQIANLSTHSKTGSGV